MAAPPGPESIALLDRFVAALTAKGIVTEEEIATQITRTDRASPETGARMVARAWTDPAYRELLLRDGSAAAEAMGVSMAGAPPLGVLEDTGGLHHLVVCTLCSCYPRAVLGYPPHWYKSAAYRARAVRDPRAVLAEWGTVLPDGMELRVVDSTADYRWMVLPMRPAGTEAWDAARLAALVTRDALVGVALPRAADSLLPRVA
jgi:nitrile hydratase